MVPAKDEIVVKMRREKGEVVVLEVVSVGERDRRETPIPQTRKELKGKEVDLKGEEVVEECEVVEDEDAVDLAVREVEEEDLATVVEGSENLREEVEVIDRKYSVSLFHHLLRQYPVCPNFNVYSC